MPFQKVEESVKGELTLPALGTWLQAGPGRGLQLGRELSWLWCLCFVFARACLSQVDICPSEEVFL